MARIHLLDDTAVGLSELVGAIRERRGGQLIELDRLLLHSPPVAEGWTLLMGNIRNKLTLDPLLAELAICAVAIMNKANYELHHHAPPFLMAGGTQQQLDALPGLLDEPGIPEQSELFDARQLAVLMLVYESTRHVSVGDVTFAAARQALGSDRVTFELVVTIAAYNMVSRILVALELNA